MRCSLARSPHSSASRASFAQRCGVFLRRDSLLQREDGVAFITFGIFVALLGILLLAANVKFGQDHGSNKEIRTKLEESLPF